jgi:hypothetical protein
VRLQCSKSASTLTDERTNQAGDGRVSVRVFRASLE